MATAAEPWRRAGIGYRRRSLDEHVEPARVVVVAVTSSFTASITIRTHAVRPFQRGCAPERNGRRRRGVAADGATIGVASCTSMGN